MGTEKQLCGPRTFLPFDRRVLSAPFERGCFRNAAHGPVVDDVPSESSVCRNVIQKPVNVVLRMTGCTAYLFLETYAGVVEKALALPQLGDFCRSSQCNLTDTFHESGVYYSDGVRQSIGDVERITGVIEGHTFGVRATWNTGDNVLTTQTKMSCVERQGVVVHGDSIFPNPQRACDRTPTENVHHIGARRTDIDGLPIRRADNVKRVSVVKICIVEEEPPDTSSPAGFDHHEGVRDHPPLIHLRFRDKVSWYLRNGENPLAVRCPRYALMDHASRGFHTGGNAPRGYINDGDFRGRRYAEGYSVRKLIRDCGEAIIRRDHNIERLPSRTNGAQESSGAGINDAKVVRSHVGNKQTVSGCIDCQPVRIEPCSEPIAFTKRSGVYHHYGIRFAASDENQSPVPGYCEIKRVAAHVGGGYRTPRPEIDADQFATFLTHDVRETPVAAQLQIDRRFVT
ncbi:MAG: hypothetical protein BWY06_01830 [Candidatus Latescibacteria bacterium ADurb.Bin168]|nr:MAG: hypothetical protein BWY06_01830 [Candidatus Latescibacteria bacterium ADurb.Bin168]